MKVWLVYVGISLYDTEHPEEDYSVYCNKPKAFATKKAAKEYKTKKENKQLKKLLKDHKEYSMKDMWSNILEVKMEK